ncbi:hypothetical protein HMPREF0541_00796 [Lacticaseibacillus rhamnosus ATCC 21052]|nr:hypothetical protein HMPREF0541_00796 [Lacticaseibacillus rhamnosus ATCC 21052]
MTLFLTRKIIEKHDLVLKSFSRSTFGQISALEKPVVSLDANAG